MNNKEVTTIQHLSKEEIVTGYASCGLAFVKACDYVASQVPKELFHNGKKYTHFPTHYDAGAEIFCYLDSNCEAIFLSKQQVIEFNS